VLDYVVNDNCVFTEKTTKGDVSELISGYFIVFDVSWCLFLNQDSLIFVDVDWILFYVALSFFLNLYPCENILIDLRIRDYLRKILFSCTHYSILSVLRNLIVFYPPIAHETLKSSWKNSISIVIQYIIIKHERIWTDNIYSLLIL